MNIRAQPTASQPEGEMSALLDDRPVTGGQPATGATLLELRGLDKRYTGTHALKRIDLAFQAGEIHAIVGENGAGKSTLIKVLTGAVPRTAGEIIWQGREVEIATPHDAIALGINAVHQEVVLCPHLTVAANMFLGDERVRRWSASASRHGARSARHPRRHRLRHPPPKSCCRR